jgi:protein involved in polysaccharide export with SLBB domain
MKFGEGRSLGQHPGTVAGVSDPGYIMRTLSRLTLGLFFGLLVGCASGPSRFDQTLMADKGAIARNQGVEQAYHVFCPDVLEITIDPSKEPTRGKGNRQLALVSIPSLSSSSIFATGNYAIDADGRIDLGRPGKLRIEGRSVLQIADLLSAESGVPSDQIHVKVAQYNSQQIYLYGQVMPASAAREEMVDGSQAAGGPSKSSQRAVPYLGPETVLDLLQRIGGITPGAAPNDVSIVRSRFADSEPPLVFHIDLRAIVMNQDQSTNIRLQPFDRVFVGEAKKSSLEKCLPPFVRPLYEKMCGMRRPGSFSYGEPLPVQNLKANLAARSTSGQAAVFRGASGER